MVNVQLIEDKRLLIYADYKQQKMYGILFLIPSIFFVIALVIHPLFILVGFILLCLAIRNFSHAFHINKSFRDIVKKEIISKLIKEHLEDVSYDAKAFIPVSKIIKTGIIKSPDKSIAEDYIKGIYKGIGFEVCDIDYQELITSPNEHHSSYETYFKGRWYIYTFNRIFNDELIIIEKNGFGHIKSNLEKIETESIEFNQKFSVYATTQTFGFYIITSTMIERLLEVEKMHHGRIFYYLSKNELHVGIDDRKDYLEISLKKPSCRYRMDHDDNQCI